MKWSVAGADSSKFEVDPATGATTTLAFKAAPDFEVAGDANGDNVYEVTVVVTDSKANTGMRAVTIKVTNIKEDGVVTLSSLQPRIGVPITASLTDPDDGVSGVTWQWYNGPITPDDLTINAIDKATSATYTPVTADNNRNLMARASYNDGQGADSAVEESASPVAVDTRNKAPEFQDQDADTAGDQLDQERSVMEDAAADAPVGEPVTANTDDPNLTYTLGGADSALFAIDRARGQISVKAGTKLDKETQDTYTVTVTATDSFGISSTITVTIKVTDVDEPPVIRVGGLVISGPGTLGGDDAGDFSISSSGELTFVSAPDYENAADADGDNVYMVTVEADDGTYTATRNVVVTVTDVEEEEVICDTLLCTYDTSGNGEIEPDEMRVAVGQFFADPPQLTTEEMRELVGIYFSS